MFSTPWIVPEVGVRAMIAPGFMRSMAEGSRRGLKYPSPGKGCQAHDAHFTCWTGCVLGCGFASHYARFCVVLHPQVW